MSRLIAIAFLALLVSSPAYAYLDPGTGSILVQLLSGRRKPAEPEHRDVPPE